MRLKRNADSFVQDFPYLQYRGRAPGLNTAALPPHEGQALQGVFLGLQKQFPPASFREQEDRCRKGSQVDRDVQRQKDPEERGGHVFDKHPHRIAVSMINGEVAPLASRRRSARVMNDRFRNIDGSVPGQTKPESEIDVLQITEEISSNPPPLSKPAVDIKPPPQGEIFPARRDPLC